MMKMVSKEIKGEILIVDDDLPSLRALSNLLTDQGYQVRSARDGSTALMIATAEPPDLILLDVTMPGMDGLQVCQQLKSNPQTNKIPVIFVSGLDEVVDKVSGFAVGGVDYITKPFKADEVIARVKTHLTLHRLGNELQQEINQRIRTEQRLRERSVELGDRVNELTAINRIAHMITTNPDLKKALPIVAETITDLFGIHTTLFSIPEMDKNELQIMAGYERSGGSIPLMEQAFSMADTPITRSVVNKEQTLVIPDLDYDQLAEPVRKYVEERNLHSVLLVPLRARGVVFGTMTLATDQIEREFSEFDISLAETIAGEIAAAIENEMLTEQTRRAAVDAERQRLARELHDSVTQSIYSLTLLSSGWESMSEQGTLEEPADSFRQLGEVAGQALREMRLLIHQLRPSLLEEVGLVQALQQRLDSVELRANIESDLIIRGDFEDLPPDVEDQLFHIAQEALNNSLRHAHASRVTVELLEEKNKLRLSVVDDGKGFDIGQETTGMGLGNIRDRAKSINADAAIKSEVDQGTCIQVTLTHPIMSLRDNE
jgi:signal transduction histidine kinase/DNA-binding response OmpR family regulator